MTTVRKNLLTLLCAQPRSVSSLARDLGLRKGDVDDDLQHALRSARAAGHRVIVIPARCRSCGFIFDEEKLSKALDAWTESVSALATWIRYSPPPPDAKPVEPWFDDEPDDDGGPETMH